MMANTIQWVRLHRLGSCARISSSRSLITGSSSFGPLNRTLIIFDMISSRAVQPRVNQGGEDEGNTGTASVGPLVVEEISVGNDGAGRFAVVHTYIVDGLPSSCLFRRNRDGIPPDGFAVVSL